MLWCVLLCILINSNSSGSGTHNVTQQKEEMIIAFVRAFLCTWLIETSILILLLKSTFKLKRILLISTFLNICTLPFVWFVFPQVLRNYSTYLIIAEAFAYTTEALLLLLITKELQIAIKTSLIANTASLLFGVILFY